MLPSGVVHVIAGDLDLGEDRLAEVGRFLAPEELDRASRFRFARDRNRFTAGRGLLRELLGGYLGVRPEQVAFSYGPYGKPALAGRQLFFNVSHSGATVVFAFCRGAEVGVDVERLGNGCDDESVARRFFARREVEELFGLPPARRPRAFLTCWTRKEAYIKARGEGLSLPLQEFQVTLVPGEPPRLVRTDWEPSEASEWRIHDLWGIPDTVAALAVRGHEVPLVMHSSL